MKRLEAATKDRSAATWRERTVMYRVGSYFKGCRHCGETEEVEVGSSGRTVLRYLSGYDVFRAYDPAWSGFTWWCYTCGAKDLRCWSPDQSGMVEAELGKPPIQGTRGVKVIQKYRLRSELVKMGTKVEVPSRAAEIARLEDELARLMAMLKGRS